MPLFNQSGQSKSLPPLSVAPKGPVGKTEPDEAFPVACLLRRRHRPVVRQFYRIVREADDLADSPDISLPDKMSGLARIRQRTASALPPQIAHCAEALLDAFQEDCTNPSCPSWTETLRSARRSSTPVGRMLLILHDGEDQHAAEAADALCMALQLLNHIGDAHADLNTLNRSYLPQDWLAEAGQDPAPVLTRMLKETRPFLAAARPLIRQIHAPRLAFQAAVTLACAHRLATRLERRTDWRHSPHFGPVSLGIALVHGVFLFLRFRWRA